MNCIACGKETNKEICHECAIIKSKKHFTNEELIYFKNLKEIRISSIDELQNNKFLQKYTKITFKCESCGKDYTGDFKNIRKKSRLLCSACQGKQYYTNTYGEGITNTFQLESTKQKIKESVQEKYGVDCFLQTQEARDARRQYNTDYFKNLTHQRLDKYCSSITFSNENHRRNKDEYGIRHYQDINCTCSTCSTEYITTAKRFQRCPKCFPEDWMNGTSKLEREILIYIMSISPYNVKTNVRGIIGNKELDIFIPDINLAIEIDGDYWHGYHDIQTDFRGIQTHSGDKQIMCTAKGIRLITIKECDYTQRENAFKLFLKDVICPRQKVYARKCTYKEISTKEAKDFCEMYHINGFRGGYYKCGLFYKDELVCVAVFGKHKIYENECIRLCYKTSIDIIGGWDKIIKHFGKQFLHYVNLMYFPGTPKTDIGYRFVNKDKILSRNTMEKNTQLYKYCKNIDESLSDYQNAVLNGFTVVFDCGNDIRIYNKKAPEYSSGAITSFKKTE